MNPAETLRETEIGAFPASWEIRSLDQLFDVQQGKALSPKARMGHSPRPFLRTANVLWGRLNLAALDRMDFSDDEAKRLALEPGDLLVCEGGDVGRTALWRGEVSGCLHQNHVHRLRRKDAGIHPEFVMYWMQAAVRQLGLYAGTENKTTIPNLSAARLKHFLMPVPPPREQGAIATVLQKTQSAVEFQERKIALLKELKAATMAKLFREGLKGERPKQTEIGEIPESWEVHPLSELCARTEIANLSDAPGDSFAYVDVSAVSNEDLRILSTVLHTSASAPSRARKRVHKGDTIFATVRPTLRRVAEIPEHLDGQIVSTAFCVLRALPDAMVPDYLFCVVSRPEFSEALGGIQRGASYPAVTDKDVMRQLVPRPPKLDEQRAIARAILGIQAKLWRASRVRLALSGLFSDMLHLLMIGRIRLPLTSSTGRT